MLYVAQPIFMVSFESSQKLPLPPKILYKAGFNIKTYFFKTLGREEGFQLQRRVSNKIRVLLFMLK